MPKGCQTFCSKFLEEGGDKATAINPNLGISTSSSDRAAMATVRTRHKVFQCAFFPIRISPSSVILPPPPTPYYPRAKADLNILTRSLGGVSQAPVHAGTEPSAEEWMHGTRAPERHQDARAHHRHGHVERWDRREGGVGDGVRREVLEQGVAGESVDDASEEMRRVPSAR